MKTSLNFSEWVALLFDHPARSDLTWMDDRDKAQESVELTEALNLEYCIRLFENPHSVLNKFSDEQIVQGFHYLIAGYGATRIPHVENASYLHSETLSLTDRIRFINSIYTLFANFFAPKCNQEKENSFAYCVCNWWGSYRGGTGTVTDLEIRKAFLDLLVNILKIDNSFCQQSSIEELGLSHPSEAARIINDFLKRPDITSQSRDFALKWKEVLASMQ